MSVILTMFPFVLSTKNKYPSEVIEKIIFSEIIGLNSELIFCIQFINPELESIEKKVLLLFEKNKLPWSKTNFEDLIKKDFKDSVSVLVGVSQTKFPLVLSRAYMSPLELLKYTFESSYTIDNFFGTL